MSDGSTGRSRTARRTTETLAARLGGRRLAIAWRSRSQTTTTFAARSTSRRSQGEETGLQLERQAQPPTVDVGAEREGERQAVDQIDQERYLAEILQMDRQANELKDAQIRRGSELAQPAAEVGLVEEAALERQVFDQRPDETRKEARAAMETVGLDPEARAFGRRDLLRAGRRGEEGDLVPRRQMWSIWTARI